jgi:hypothetical protein
MRFALALLPLAGLAAACSSGPREVSSTPPTVSYQVAGNDVSQANVRAARYCQQYGMAAQLEGIQSTASGNTAVYACSGSAASNAYPSFGAAQNSPYYQGSPAYGSSAPPVRCADALHQDRPGGTDYRGPPVVGCP